MFDYKYIMPVIEIENDDHLSEVVSQYDYVIVDFYINSCQPCKLFAPVYEELSNNEKYKNIGFVKVNAYDSNCRDIASEYNVCKFPTFIILEKSRELLHKPINGSKDVIQYLDSLVDNLDDNLDEDF